jgi:hypothetical protein
MATIHISEIEKILRERGAEDILRDGSGFFLEIRFDPPPDVRRQVVDLEMKDAVITSNSEYGFVTIQFDRYGELKSIDIS